jgi:hypothetical protein
VAAPEREQVVEPVTEVGHARLQQHAAMVVADRPAADLVGAVAQRVA